MDTTTFDQFTRLIAQGRSRRSLLRLLLGSGVGSIAAGLRRASAGAQPCVDTGLPCELDTDCCEGFCSDQDQVCFIPCLGFGETCQSSDECCLPLICTNGACGLPCAPLGDSCAELPCCEGTCSAGSLCEDSVTCLEEQHPCSAASLPCCEGFSCTGGCCGGCVFVCIAEHELCEEGVPCCGDHSCVGECCGGCLQVECIPPQQPCHAEIPCCEDIMCIDECCGGCLDCIQEGEPCQITGCCPGLVCNEFMMACVPACADVGEECEHDEDCCDLTDQGLLLTCRRGLCLSCALTGHDAVCGKDITCCEPGTTCNEAAGTCVFVVCAPKWTPCEHDDECCNDLICDEKTRVCKDNRHCGSLGDHCNTPIDCCHGLTCFEGICDVPEGCVDEGAPCRPDVPCCDTLACDGKHCARNLPPPEKPPGGISALPNTGVDGRRSSSGWLEVLSTGGVALVAASLLRRSGEHRNDPEEL